MGSVSFPTQPNLVKFNRFLAGKGRWVEGTGWGKLRWNPNELGSVGSDGERGGGKGSCVRGHKMRGGESVLGSSHGWWRWRICLWSGVLRLCGREGERGREWGAGVCFRAKMI